MGFISLKNGNKINNRTVLATIWENTNYNIKWHAHYLAVYLWTQPINKSGCLRCTIYKHHFFLFLFFLQYFSYIMADIIGGGNRSMRRKPPTCRKSLTNLITLSCIEYTSPLTGFELTVIAQVVVDPTTI